VWRDARCENDCIRATVDTIRRTKFPDLEKEGMKVTLDVGGTIFVTTRDTLAMRNSFFKALVSSDATTTYFFIDRDPTFFRWILNLLRGSTLVPNNRSEYDQLKAEADFYCLALPPYNHHQGLEYELQRITSRLP
jgi:hypothetical protein